MEDQDSFIVTVLALLAHGVNLVLLEYSNYSTRRVNSLWLSCISWLHESLSSRLTWQHQAISWKCNEPWATLKIQSCHNANFVITGGSEFVFIRKLEFQGRCLFYRYCNVSYRFKIFTEYEAWLGQYNARISLRIKTWGWALYVSLKT